MKADAMERDDGAAPAPAPASTSPRPAGSMAALARASQATLPGAAVVRPSTAPPLPRTRTPQLTTPKTGVGAVVGDYQLVAELGAGGMGTVYVGRHRVLGRKVAVKVMSSEVATGQNAARFVNEAKAAVRIAHPAIVDVIHVGITLDRRPYMVMELLAGESLDRRLARVGRLPLAEALRLTRQIAEALAAAHAAGVIHRDLKPANIFLVEDARGGERVKLIDFGIAKLTAELAGAVRTAAHAVLGTPTYMAPEQARASVNVDARTDLYALGCILFEMLAGSPPFTVTARRAIEAQGQMLRAHELTPPPPLPDGVASPPVAALLARLLAKRPDERPPSARHVVEAVDRLRRPVLGRGATVALGLAGVALGALLATVVVRRLAPEAATEPGRAAPPPVAAPPLPPTEAAPVRVTEPAPPPPVIVAEPAAPPPAVAAPRPDPRAPRRPRSPAPSGAAPTPPVAPPTTVPDVAGPPADQSSVHDLEAAARGDVALRAYFDGKYDQALRECLRADELGLGADLPYAACAMAACRLARPADAATFAAHLPAEQRATALRRCAALAPLPSEPPG